MIELCTLFSGYKPKTHKQYSKGVRFALKPLKSEHPKIAPQQPLVMFAFYALIHSRRGARLILDPTLADAEKRSANLIPVSKKFNSFNFNPLHLIPRE